MTVLLDLAPFALLLVGYIMAHRAIMARSEDAVPQHN